MSKEFKLVLGVIAVLAVGILGFLMYQVNQVNYTSTAYKSLEDLKATGEIEVKSYQEWSKKNNVKNKTFEVWRQRELKKRQMEKENKKQPTHPVTPSTSNTPSN